METYHKINALYKRHREGPDKGKFIAGEWACPEFEYLANNQWEFTEKVDGTNIRIGYGVDETPVSFSGRTDNAVIPKPLMEYLTTTFTMDRLEQSGIESNFVLFGEGYGPKIQGGGKYRDDTSFVLFDVKIGDFWLDRANVDDIADKLGINSVPVIGYGTLYDAMEMVQPWPLGTGPLVSKWGDFEPEGIVARPVVPMFNRKGERVIAKIKAVDFR